MLLCDQDDQVSLGGLPRIHFDYWLNNQGRITEPMFLDKNSNNYSPISWDDALSKISNKLNTLSSPNKAVFYTSGRTSNEAAFLYQAFIRSFGTNNFPSLNII